MYRQNLNYAAVCNGAGQAFGIFLGHVLPIVLVSEKFWNKYWRTTPLPHGVITLQGIKYVQFLNKISTVEINYKII